VAGTFDLATQSLKIFLDGVEVPSTFLSGHDVPITAINDSSSPVRIGALVNSSGVVDFFWNGRIDEPALYSRALSAAEIQSIFDAGSAGKTTGESIGVTALNANTVHSNGGGNQLTGGADRDLFFASLVSELLDWDLLTEEEEWIGVL